MKKILMMFLIISMLVLAGCMQLEDLYKPLEPEPDTTQAAIDEVEDSINEIGALEQELDLSELDEIEKELDEINW